MSIITSLGSVILSLLLLRQHKKGATETAAEAVSCQNHLKPTYSYVLGSIFERTYSSHAWFGNSSHHVQSTILSTHVEVGAVFP